MVLRATKKSFSRINAPRRHLPRVAIVLSLFNEGICRGLLLGAQECLSENGYDRSQVAVFEVPGAFEIPLVARRLLQSSRFDGVIALGCVIRGDTPHFEYVSQGATLGCQWAALQSGKPVAFGILTTDTEEQAVKRSSPDAFNKGREAVAALIMTMNTLKSVGK